MVYGWYVVKPDRFRKQYRVPPATERLRRQIALEAARRLLVAAGPEEKSGTGWLEGLAEGDFYAAKRKAAAVLGHRVRPGDLPADSEVRAQAIALIRERESGSEPAPENESPEPVEGAVVAQLADHLDRFAIYKLRLEPLESVKQDPKSHPEGDALFHSLQVFELAREARPYDEEFLLAALLHDVGKAIAPQDRVNAAVESLRGAVTERTLWLIAHQKEARAARERTLSTRDRKALEASEFFDDLMLLFDLDAAGHAHLRNLVGAGNGRPSEPPSRGDSARPVTSACALICRQLGNCGGTSILEMRSI